MRTLWIIITAIFLFNSCGKKEVKQFKFAGGSIKMAIDNEPSTYNSMEVSDYFSASVVSQIMEGLVAIDPKSLQIIPQIASSWKISDDGLKYEFLIRSDVLFHANPMFVSQSDRILKPKDVKYTFEYICSKKHNGRVLHAYNYLFKDLLEGAEAFMEGKASSISGVELNGQKIILTLVKKDENFLNKLANICAAIHSEKILKNNVNELIVGTGPFQFESFSSGPPKSVILVKNKDYYLKDKEGNQLPYLDKLEFFFENRKQTQLAMFEKHLTDIILGLPTDKIAKMLEGRIKD
jgi:oligopeptide transport system substrate-binding protein